MVKSNPAYPRAITSRNSVLHVLLFNRKGKLEGSGSSFVIKRDVQARQSIILTCAHVVEDWEPGYVLLVRRKTWRGIQELPAIIIDEDPFADVAILRVPGLTAVPPLGFAPEYPVAGQRTMAIGYCDPLNLFSGRAFTRIPAMSSGRVRPKVTKWTGTHNGVSTLHLRLDCVGMEGMSGGPVVSRRGVVAMTAEGRPGRLFCVHWDTILQVLKSTVQLDPNDNSTMEQVINLLV